ncbi:transposable element Tcb1 transposase [Trichonephila clavipes]|nr:transposable element Tcb1 transposase [Trichonephila clavipes]
MGSEHRAWQADWHQVVFSDESRFNLWDHDGRIRIRRYAGERCLPKGVLDKKGESFKADWTWRASHHQESENYWEGRPAQPPGVGGAFEKLFCRPLRPAALDGGLNWAWLTWCGS